MSESCNLRWQSKYEDSPLAVDSDKETSIHLFGIVNDLALPGNSESQHTAYINSMFPFLPTSSHGRQGQATYSPDDTNPVSH